MLSIYLLLHTNINAFSIYNNCLFLVYVFILFSLVVLVVVLENHYFLVDVSVLQLTVTFLLCLQSGKKRVCVCVCVSVRTFTTGLCSTMSDFLVMCCCDDRRCWMSSGML